MGSMGKAPVVHEAMSKALRSLLFSLRAGHEEHRPGVCARCDELKAIIKRQIDAEITRIEIREGKHMSGRDLIPVLPLDPKLLNPYRDKTVKAFCFELFKRGAISRKHQMEQMVHEAGITMSTAKAYVGDFQRYVKGVQWERERKRRGSRA